MNDRIERTPTVYVLRLAVLVLIASAMVASARAGEVTPVAKVRPFEIVNLDGLFKDHMVLQRGKKVPVWGITQPGVEVTVEFAGQTKTAKGGDDGRWMVHLDPMKASFKGRTLTVTGGGHAIEVKDVLVGDIWVLAGQSNMEQRLRTDTPAMAKEKNIPQTIDAIRVAHVEAFPVHPKSGIVEAHWWPFSWANVNKYHMSRVGFYFARELSKLQKMPVGIYQSAHGGSPISRWLDYSEISGSPPVDTDYLRGIFNYSPKNKKRRKKSKAEKQYEEQVNRIRKEHPDWKVIPPGPQSVAHWHYEQDIEPAHRMAICGFFWYQGEADGNEGYSYRYIHPMQIRQWRADFAVGDETLPWISVEIPPVDGYFAGMEYLREAQRMAAMKDDKMGIVITTDLGPTPEHGHGLGIHSAPKKPIGERAAMVANVMVHGAQGDYWGPVYKSVEFEGPKAIVSFENLHGGLTTAEGSGKVNYLLKYDKKEFLTVTMAGKDRQFYPARAVIEGDKLVVTCDKVEEPAAVRVGFDNYAPINLVNEAGMPVAAFRTDDWKSRFDGRPWVDTPIKKWVFAPGDDPSKVSAWKPLSRNIEDNGLIDLKKVPELKNQKAACLKTVVSVPRATEALLWLRAGMPDRWGRIPRASFKVWCNGRRWQLPADASGDTVLVNLKKGDNVLVISPDQSKKKWLVVAGLSTTKDEAIPGLEIKKP